MKDITKKWLDFAKTDLDAAIILYKGENRGRRTDQICVLHCHQAVEKFF